MQLTALIESMERHDARERISRVADATVGAQSDSKGVKAHMKELFAAAEMEDPSVKGVDDFLRDFGAGI